MIVRMLVCAKDRRYFEWSTWSRPYLPVVSPDAVQTSIKKHIFQVVTDRERLLCALHSRSQCTAPRQTMLANWFKLKFGPIVPMMTPSRTLIFVSVIV